MSTARLPVAGFLLAVGSAASFALSGIFASALITSGWSAGAATTVRITGAALMLLVPTLVMLRGKWQQVRRAWGSVLLFGLLAVIGCQLAFFFAVQFIPPSLALVIEFMGPVLLMFWMWARTRVAPTAITLAGAALAFLGLLAVSGVAFGESLHPLGIMFALIAAVGVAAYYALGASSTHGIEPLPFVGLGFIVAALGLTLTSVWGVLPFTFSTTPAVIAGAPVPMPVAVAGMVLIATVLPYVLGVSASRRLGATVASFTGYSEPLFGIVWTIALLALVPTGLQCIGAALIIVGVVGVKLGEYRGARARRSVQVRPRAPQTGLTEPPHASHSGTRQAETPLG